jgi:hypothetical protein
MRTAQRSEVLNTGPEETTRRRGLPGGEEVGSRERREVGEGVMG